ncbi:helix-turn-helix transcriptional regulator [uncultured Catenibacterium sp.]|uniref:helix-turn-helix domain-containing protein n=1 Tax=uncultured Catenibacterium sp. TaxID=286142 RepID=UPI0025FA9600|nr:helix-turn-helix transcriptional regulator [uncultured Catenibacterium sp.]
MYQTNERNIVGQNLQVLINKRNWTIKHAAKELNYDRIKLSRILSGAHNFKLQTMVKFARYFDISVFLLFDRLFENEDYRNRFPFVDTNYMNVFTDNFKSQNIKQSTITLDPATISHIINGHRSNPTINTLLQIAEDSKTSLSELLKTDSDKKISNNYKKD